MSQEQPEQQQQEKKNANLDAVLASLRNRVSDLVQECAFKDGVIAAQEEELQRLREHIDLLVGEVEGSEGTSVPAENGEVKDNHNGRPQRQRTSERKGASR